MLFSLQLPNDAETTPVTTPATLINETKIENSTKIAVISYGGIFRAPYIAEVFNNWTVSRGLGRLVECEAFGVVDPSALHDTDPTVIHLLTSQQILYRGKPLALFKQETMKYYDFILATDKKSWFALRDLAPDNDTMNRIELLSLYDPQRRAIDMPDIFYAMYRRDLGRKMKWMCGFVAHTVKAFMFKHIDNMKYRAGITTTTTSTTIASDTDLFDFNYNENEEMHDDINAEFDYTVPAF